ncbi:MAG: hypothetical protein JNK51_14530 [Blastocatellia bacterium]|nr:hypothetical protein [Chloracidobacterium sp.]MBL8186128.1 hypothetical protein [Blastocatellia bacterium]HBE82476.1 hypothetical protein [Blastocatellia bacterium]HRJ88513.1 hypothetical protein [Pyrinomonadaceae bacterium]HRK50440.1 hypothetical protein [Pyrinomonadaceae bacterium]
MADMENYQAPADLERIRTIALGAGGIALIAWAVGLYFSPEQALRSWLLGFIFWGGISIGSIGVLMLQYLTGGAWGVVIRRLVEAGSRTLPLVVVLFIPLAFITYYHYWTTWSPDDYAIAHRGWFMTQESWILRSAIYFSILLVIVYLLNKWSSQQDNAKSYDESARYLGTATAFSGPTLVVYSLVVTFAVVDWVMMLDAHWFSTIWGLLFVAGWALSCFCFCVVMLMYLAGRSPMNRVLGKRHFHDIGKLMLALTMVWAYFNFSQFLIIWSGNIPEETGWYLTRMKGPWLAVGALLVLFHFAFPFLILLQQDFKRKAKWLATLAVFILIMRLVDMFYLIAPNPRIDKTIEKGAFIVSWLDFAAPIAIGGIWLWYFIGQLRKRPIVPVMDPFLEKAIEHGKGH